MDAATAIELDGFDDRPEFRKMFYDDLVGCGRFDEDVERFRRRLESLQPDEAQIEANRIAEQFLGTLQGIDGRLTALKTDLDQKRLLDEEHGLVLELYVALKLGPIVRRYCNGTLAGYQRPRAGT